MSRFSTAIPHLRRSPVEQALHQLVRSPDARLEAMLIIPAEFARTELAADSTTLLRWQADELEPLAVAGQPELYHPTPPIQPSNLPELLKLDSGGYRLHLDLKVDGRSWGQLWATRSARYTEADLVQAQEVLRDVAGMLSAAQRLHAMARMALEDSLTGLNNRRAFEESLAELLKSDGQGATVIMCDINNLKYINDQFGHLAGDQAIIHTAKSLSNAAATEPGAMVARLGGDEFAVLLPGAKRSAAIGLVSAAAQALALTEQAVTISSGVAVTPAGLSTIRALSLADEAQYAAKSRQALLVVATTSPGDSWDSWSKPVGEARPPNRRRDRPLPSSAEKPPLPSTTNALVLAVVAEVAAQLAQPSASVGATLRWLGERMLGPFDCAEWAVSQVNLAGDRQLRTDSMGVNGSMVGPDRYDDQVDSAFPVDDYPLTLAAVRDARWFAADRADPDCEPGERSVLDVMGMSQLVAIGCPEGDHGWLLELYGRRSERDLPAMGQLMALSLSALLRRPITQIHHNPKD